MQIKYLLLGGSPWHSGNSLACWWAAGPPACSFCWWNMVEQTTTWKPRDNDPDVRFVSWCRGKPYRNMRDMWCAHGVPTNRWLTQHEEFGRIRYFRNVWSLQVTFFEGFSNRKAVLVFARWLPCWGAEMFAGPAGVWSAFSIGFTDRLTCKTAGG